MVAWQTVFLPETCGKYSYLCGMISLQVFTFNAFEENTYVLYTENEAFVVDPGCYDPEERNELQQFVEQKNLRVTAVLNTHCHVDHVLGNAFCTSRWKAPLWIHPLEDRVLRAVATYASNYRFHQYHEKLADRFFAPNERLTLGQHELEILFVPGHAPGHVAFYNRAQKWVVAGDVLFHRSIGRTDLPGGNIDTLIHSIHHQLFTLPDDVVVYPGHGPETTVGAEKKWNPFCALSPAS
jgi:glyoxylase-like metal-dependent hydrolase (beta-lactamase superfamily II)